MRDRRAEPAVDPRTRGEAIMADKKGGLPGLCGTEHIGVTVPDLDQAVEFFVEVLGCQEFFPLGPFQADDDWMAVHLGVHPRAVVKKMRYLRCAHGSNLELFEYEAPDQERRHPKNSDIGACHLGFYVEDLDAAVAYLKDKGVEIQGEPTTMTSGPSAGNRWVYFRAPWGLQLELISSPDGQAYEANYEDRLWHPKYPHR
jgi:catechol 2,3-dioxygenase-like lactoylglutathione lyase family enzyme